MKIMTILGTRPEVIRLSRIIEKLDGLSKHVLVHTGQNFDDRLNGLFFREMDIRAPDEFMNIQSASFGQQIGEILTHTETLLSKHRPDRILVLGDTNSGLSAIVARRYGFPVYHMEAGNRCYDLRVPEESNRRIIDHLSEVLLPYTNRSRENLLREGFAANSVYVTGNPIFEVIQHYDKQIRTSKVLEEMGVEEKKFFLVTIHRAENVDVPERLNTFIEALVTLAKRYNYPVICSLHPRLKAKAQQHGVNLDDIGIRFVPPLGFFSFVRLEKSAFCVLSDSGTVQEEACIFRVPALTLRDVTERPETIECGSNVLSGCSLERILQLVEYVTQRGQIWNPPPEYLEPAVSDTVCSILLGYRLGPGC